MTDLAGSENLVVKLGGIGMPIFGMEWHHTLYYVVIPVLAGGVGEGAIPLSIGYGQILHLPSGPLLATILPAAMLLQPVGSDRTSASGRKLTVTSTSCASFAETFPMPIKSENGRARSC